MIQPTYLKAGDTVGITCPAKKLTVAEIETAINILKSWDLNVVLGETVGASHHQFAGNDDLRRKDFQQMLNNPNINAIICGRGGYGTVKIIDDLDFTAFMKQPKWIVGFSDITYLHILLNCNIGVESLHAPMMTTLKNSTTASIHSIKEALFGKLLHYTFDAHEMNRNGVAEGEVIGGNLSIIYSLLGTKSIVHTKDAILFIEDLDEYLYHIDRMMMALKRAGKLQFIKGLIVGGMTNMIDNDIPYGQTAYEIIQEHCAAYNFPICYNFPAGHIADNRAIILGKKAKLTVGTTCMFEQ
ncbi:MAG: LD-carboxypeptidase [Chitinophagales bacterium]|nr:LD-carboxypeptidase [Chitinophagales bacterium]